MFTTPVKTIVKRMSESDVTPSTSAHISWA